MGTKKYLEYSKYLIVFIIVIGIINLIYDFITLATSGKSIPSPILSSVLFYFTYIGLISSVAFNFAVFFILLYLINKEKQNNLENKHLNTAKLLIILSIILGVIGYFAVIILNMNFNGQLTSLSFLSHLTFFNSLGSLAFYLAILLVIVYYLTKKNN